MVHEQRLGLDSYLTTLLNTPSKYEKCFVKTENCNKETKSCLSNVDGATDSNPGKIYQKFHTVNFKVKKAKVL
jgi:hypothetical protein